MKEIDAAGEETLGTATGGTEGASMKELLQQALDALMLDHSEGLTVQEGKFLDSTAAAIRAALAEQLEQEPVAWGVFDHNLHDMFFAKEEAHEMVRLKGDGSTVKPLYTTPPQRQWVGLTDEEGENFKGLGLIGIELVEAKLKEKNNG